MMPLDVIAFYRKVAKLSNCSMNQAMNVVLAIEALKITGKGVNTPVCDDRKEFGQ